MKMEAEMEMNPRESFGGERIEDIPTDNRTTQALAQR